MSDFVIGAGSSASCFVDLAIFISLIPHLRVYAQHTTHDLGSLCSRFYNFDDMSCWLQNFRKRCCQGLGGFPLMRGLLGIIWFRLIIGGETFRQMPAPPIWSIRLDTRVL
jgi:hypothetical protein